MSRLRARCPDCATLTAVAVGADYECHACGRAFPAGLVRVPRAWGAGGEPMASAAALPLPLPEAAVVDCAALAAQTEAIADGLPELPVVLGGCCCAHTGAVRGLARRVGRLGVVWLDAHGDLNTPETSVSGNPWGMPLRASLDDGDVEAADVALVGARNLDPPEADYVLEHGLDDDLARALEGVDAVYVAFDVDVLDERVVRSYLPEPGGLALEQAEQVLSEAVRRAPLAGIGFTGLAPDAANVAPLVRLLHAVGLETGAGEARTKMP